MTPASLGLLLATAAAARDASTPPGRPHSKHSIPEGAQPTPTDYARVVEPIDYESALLAGRQALDAGQSVAGASLASDAAVDRGPAVPFMPLEAPPRALRSGARLASGWLPEAEAALLQHEMVTHQGWWFEQVQGETRKHTSRRLLELREPLPPWAHPIALRLAPEFGGRTPDAMEIHACEPGQPTPDLYTGGEAPGPTAVLCLNAAATMFSRDGAEGEPLPETVSSNVLQPLDVVILGQGGPFATHRIVSSQRHLSVVFRLEGGASGQWREDSRGERLRPAGEPRRTLMHLRGRV
jgi:hypothetical protein